MCGIAGIVWHEGRAPEITMALLARMRDALHHRGPDDSGIDIDARGRVGLTNARLAIRDLSPAGHMPMRTADDRLCITYNGEIYNAAELRAELSMLGYGFRSTSDTEVVLAGYAMWGDDVVKRLRGMFAFAIADYTTEQARVLLARDPLGIKPLYYTMRGDALVFASELRAFIAAGMTERTIDRHALSAYLQLGSIPAPLTIFEDVWALDPGSLLIVDAQGARDPRTWFEMPAPQAAVERVDVREALRKAVESHLVADVPVGVFLSGGLDSSAIVALAAAHAPGLATCTIRFQEKAADESAYARAVADHFKTTHHEIVIGAADMVSGVDDIMRAIDQPSIDGFNTYFISKAAAGVGLKVALSGLGGDELFGGYPTFRGVPRVLNGVRAIRRAGLGAVAARTVSAVTRNDRWRKTAETLMRPATPESAYLMYRGLFAPGEAAALLGTSRFAFDPLTYVRNRAAGSGDVRDWVARAEIRTYTTNQLLRDADVMSMAHSLEVRMPLLDTGLVEAMLRVPAAQRLQGSGPKPMLRAALAGMLPSEVLSRREKKGFTFPLNEWLRSGQAAPLWDWQGGILDSFDRKTLASVSAGFRAGRTHWSRAWSLIVLNEWHKRIAHA